MNYKPLLEGPTWREIVLGALRDTELDTRSWTEESREMLADEILRALRRAVTPMDKTD